MSDINKILSELKKTKKTSITLPVSEKETTISKPTFKFQEDIVKIFESHEQQAALVRYRDYINKFVSDVCSSDICQIDKIYYLLSVLSSLNKADYTEKLKKLADTQFDPTEVEMTCDDVAYTFTIDVPTIERDNKFIKFALRKKDDLKLVEFAFAETFKYVNSLTVSTDKDADGVTVPGLTLTTTVAECSIEELYQVYRHLPIDVTSKVLRHINEKYVEVINSVVSDTNLEQDPTSFINL